MAQCYQKLGYENSPASLDLYKIEKSMRVRKVEDDRQNDAKGGEEDQVVRRSKERLKRLCGENSILGISPTKK